jgi:hypothetical protein
MDESLSNRIEDFDAMMNMKVMEVEDFKKHFMQTIETIVKKGMEQNYCMNMRSYKEEGYEGDGKRC